MRSLPSFRRATALCLAVLGLVAGAPQVCARGTYGEPGGVRADTASAHAPAVASADKVPEGLCSNDWSSIRAAYEANRHAVFAVEGGLQARNPGQQWVTRFDGRGASTQPDAGGWTWGLQLECYGFAGAERAVCEPTQVSTHGGRVAYDWDSTLQEWWVNDTRGLEHGYTVQTRPPQCGEGPLVFTLAVRGDLQARVQADGRGVCFSNADGVSVLTYTGLTVFDADARALAASFERGDESNRLRLRIDERGARYPLTIDPVAQQAYLKASNTNTNDYFGRSVSVSGDTVVVGANGEDSNATGVNGNQSDNSAPDAGAAYVFVRSGVNWIQQAYLKASNAGVDDRFGASVSVSGDTVVVGAIGERSNATGVDGDQSDNSLGLAGAAYVFARSGTTWTQQAYLKASNTGYTDLFGYSVSVSGDTVLVGAVNESSSATGVNGDQNDNSADGAGAGYVFVRSGATWAQQAYLKASNTGGSDNFGYSAALSVDTAVVGARTEDSRSAGVNGDQADNSGFDVGAAYVFRRSGVTWAQEAYIKSSNPGAQDYFGESISVDGDTVVVGVRSEDSNATGLNGDQSDNSAQDSGAAYVFVRSGSAWSQQAYLKASNSDSYDNFGFSVSLSGDKLVVGAPHEASNATGSNGNQSDNSLTNAGAAYVFVRSGTVWGQQVYLKASNTGSGDAFGSAVSLSEAGDTVAVGAPYEQSNATGVNGNEADNNSNGAGAAYVFIAYPSPVAYCFGDGSGTPCPCGNAGAAGNGCATSFNPLGANLSATGESAVSNDTLILQSSGLSNSTVSFFQGTTSLSGGTVFGDGLRCAAGSIIRLGSVPASGGVAQYPSGSALPVSIRGAIPATASVRYYQVWYRNAANFCTPSTFNLTNGLTVHWVP